MSYPRIQPFVVNIDIDAWLLTVLWTNERKKNSVAFDIATTQSKDIPHFTQDELAGAIIEYTNAIVDINLNPKLRIKYRARRDLAESIYIKRVWQAMHTSAKVGSSDHGK